MAKAYWGESSAWSLFLPAMLVSPDDVQGPWCVESANEKTVRGALVRRVT